MTDNANGKLNAAAQGLLLLNALYRSLDRTVLLRALEGKVPVPHVKRVPSWPVTEAFVAANPEFVSEDPRRSLWESRDDLQSRLRLMIALARELRRREGGEFYLFAAPVREDAALAPFIVSVAPAAGQTLGNAGLSTETKLRRLEDILLEAFCLGGPVFQGKGDLA